MALLHPDIHKLDFNQDLELENFDWETILLAFVQRYKITFIRLELLMLFYRNRLEMVTSEEIAKRTGYHLLEVNANISKLVDDQLLGCERKSGRGPLYYKLNNSDFTGRELVGRIIRRLAEEFDNRNGRLQIIFAILKSQEED